MASKQTKCETCGGSDLIASALGSCADCLRSGRPEAIREAKELHARIKAEFGMPGEPPQDEDGAACGRCVNACRIAEGKTGYCGVRECRAVSDGSLSGQGKVVGIGPEPDSAAVQWYHDALPTNCVADWVCPGGTGASYPQWANVPGPERGFYNLAVFYGACTFNCLFCQNWHFRELPKRGQFATPEQLAEAANSSTSCICYFGGDPTPQIDHALKASQLALERRAGSILRICWETNGAMSPGLLRKMAEQSLESGGCVKFDLKAWSEPLHIALTGSSNRQTLDNFAKLCEMGAQRREPPLAIASTLLVPGYVDEVEVAAIARFLADLDPEVPYALLAFHPHFQMHDLPTTSRKQAESCLQVAQEAGLKRVRMGNIHLLG